MKLCPKCNHSPWPFVMILFIATVTGFLTWLVLELSVPEVGPRVGAAALVFLAVGGTLLHYVLDCLKRHCRHDHRHLKSARAAAPVTTHHAKNGARHMANRAG